MAARYAGSRIGGRNYREAICHPMVCDMKNSSLPRLYALMEAPFDGFSHEHAARLKKLITDAVQKNYSGTNVEILTVMPGRDGKAMMYLQYSLYGNTTQKLTDGTILKLIRENDPTKQIITLGGLSDDEVYGLTTMEKLIIAAAAVGLLAVMGGLAYVTYAKTVPPPPATPAMLDEDGIEYAYAF